MTDGYNVAPDYVLPARYQIAVLEGTGQMHWTLYAHGARFNRDQWLGALDPLARANKPTQSLVVPPMTLGPIKTLRNSGGAWAAYHVNAPADTLAGYASEADAIAALHRYHGRPYAGELALWKAPGKRRTR